MQLISYLFSESFVGLSPPFLLTWLVLVSTSIKFRLLVIFWNNDTYTLILSKTALAQSNKYMAKYANKHHWDVHLNVGNLVYVFAAKFYLAH